MSIFPLIIFPLLSYLSSLFQAFFELLPATTVFFIASFCIQYVLSYRRESFRRFLDSSISVRSTARLFKIIVMTTLGISAAHAFPMSVFYNRCPYARYSFEGLYQCRYAVYWILPILVPVSIALYRHISTTSRTQIGKFLRASVGMAIMIISLIHLTLALIQSDGFAQHILFTGPETCSQRSPILYAVTARHPNMCFKKFGLCENIQSFTSTDPFHSVSIKLNTEGGAYERDKCILYRDHFQEYSDCAKLTDKQVSSQCNNEVAMQKMDLSYCFKPIMQEQKSLQYTREGNEYQELHYKPSDNAVYERMVCILQIGSKLSNISNLDQSFGIKNPGDYQTHISSCLSYTDVLARDICLTRLAYDTDQTSSCDHIQDNISPLKEFCRSTSQRKKLDPY